ncbi:MAG TPA: succinylglutamate desuccinylase/aspartoacylase family protein [Gammaproteobacteria bacterium]|nr:succinylglutamate desuccinylase/aspartoacylase family protein [Gammaproteobacteria bacterium]
MTVTPGQRITLDLPMASLYSHAPMSLPVQVIHSKRNGPCLFISAAIHGDEINGVEIIRRLLRLPLLTRLRGTLLAVPIVNVYGFVNRSRYLPDRRDLNRSFPGSDKGSMAARLAELFLEEIVSRSDYGVDLHTGAIHRENLPQIRANLDDPETARIASAFHVPVLLNSDIRDGSLRQIAAEYGIPILLYEAGEALRFDERAISAGVKGIVAVMRSIGMLPATSRVRQPSEPLVARASSWVRAGRSGILRITSPLGARVRRDEVVGIISDPFGQMELEVRANCAGIIIGRTNLPLVNEGEALFHIARFESVKAAESTVEAFQADELPVDPALEEEPPIV